jgi:hypothetical protein
MGWGELVTLFTINPTLTAQELNPGFCSKNLVTNCPNYGMTTICTEAKCFNMAKSSSL